MKKVFDDFDHCPYEIVDHNIEEHRGRITDFFSKQTEVLSNIWRINSVTWSN